MLLFLWLTTFRDNIIMVKPIARLTSWSNLCLIQVDVWALGVSAIEMAEVIYVQHVLFEGDMFSM